MDDKQLDKLFQEALNAPGDFQRGEAQWAEVNKRLRKDRRQRVFFWWVGSLFGILLIVGGVMASEWTSTTPEIQTTVLKPVVSNNLPIIDQSNKIKRTIKTKAKELAPPPAHVSNSTSYSLSTNKAPIETLLTTAPIDKTTPYTSTQTVNLPKSSTAIEALPTLPISELEHPHAIQYKTQPIPRSIPSSPAYLSAGWQRNFVMDNQVQDSINNGFYLGLGIRIYRRWSIDLQYQYQQRQRSTTVDPQQYGLSLPTNLYPNELPTSSSWKYDNHRINAGLSFDLVTNRLCQWQLLAGVQYDARSITQATYTYQSIYTIDTLTHPTEATALQMDSYYIGSALSFPLYKQLHFQTQYKLYAPWRRRNNTQHLVQIGLRYNF